MAVNAYLKMDGIPGPSTSKPDAVDILSFSFGATHTANYGPGASGMEARSGRANFGEVTVMKVADKTTPFLFAHCIEGSVISKVEIMYDKPSGLAGDAQVDYFKITMQDAVITSVQLSGSSENPAESVSFAYQAIEVAYAPEKQDGKLDNFIPKGYDVEKLKAWTASA